MKVRLFRDGQTEPLAEQTLNVTGDEASQVVRLNTRPADEGDFDYLVQVEPQPREMNTTNNKLTRARWPV